MKTSNDIKLLFFFSGPAMPSRNPSYKGRFEAMSKYFSGDIVTHASSEELGLKNIGRFNFIPFHYKKVNPFIRNMRLYSKVIKHALRIIKANKPYETVIISPDPLGTGLVAIIIGKITNTKVIIEVNGCFDKALTSYVQLGRPKSIMTKIKETLTGLIVPFVLRRADKVKLLYPSQLSQICQNTKNIDSVDFHVYIPIKSFLKQKFRDEKFILLIGHPWYLKGVDLLISAFLRISSEFPEHKLVVAGWCPDPREKRFFEKIAGNNQKIEFMDPLKYEDVISFMSRCSIYVSASRTEALGRVLVEAMASRKPIVAPEVDGVPNIIHNGENGLLFKKESVDDLTEKIKKVLSDKKLSEKLATNGYNYCQNHLSEEQYIEKYKHMIMSIVNQ